MLSGSLSAAPPQQAVWQRRRRPQSQPPHAAPPAALGIPSSLRSDYADFCAAAATGATLVPLFRRILSDHLTPVLAYRCLVRQDDREAPSFLLESVVNGNTSVRARAGRASRCHVSPPPQGRYSYLGAQPALEVCAKEGRVTVLDHEKGTRRVEEVEDPLRVCAELSAAWRPYRHPGLPAAFTGGFVGYTGYDSVRYAYAGKLGFAGAPDDDRRLLDIHLGLYRDVVVFDHTSKLAYCVAWVEVGGEETLAEAYLGGAARLGGLVARLQAAAPPLLPTGSVELELSSPPPPPRGSNMSKASFLGMVEAAKEHIRAGDIFQVVLSQRFERRTFADPFEVYRALRVVNPSPYMIYMQARGAILVASSPEILCRVTGERGVVNRPLAGTRRRGATPAEDAALAAELLADEKEVAEHTMLVDLGRNDVGRVAAAGSVRVERLMEIERYSHVMHISSTVTGQLAAGLGAWDALRAALPAGTVSGAPKVRAMQIIDQLEGTRRGPYGGGIGIASFTGEMDMALALRTMVVPTAAGDTLYDYARARGSAEGGAGAAPRREWLFHVQAGAGIVADSVPEAEYQETVNKAAGLARAIDLAESAFLR